MSKTVSITLRAGEKVFMNGAVLRADRQVTLELLNDVPYLFEHQIMQVEETTTPLKQLYFLLQMMIMDPSSIASTRDVFECSSKWLIEAVSNRELLAGVERTRDQVSRGRYFDALKTVRELFDIEDKILGLGREKRVRYLEAV